MSIVKNVWLRGMKKRLGGAVTYMMAGQQITRELAANVKNPRTPAQMQQRVKLASLVNFYRSMRQWAKVGAFSNKKQTWSDYNAFVSANINIAPAYLTKQQAQAGCSIVAPYVISRGVLPRVQTSYDGAITNAFRSNIYVGEIDAIEDFTLGEISTQIIANNNGINNGDQISCISVIQRTSETGPFVIQRAYEFTLNTGSTDKLPENLVAVFNVVGDEGKQMVLGHAAEEANMGCAFIISRKQGGKILTGDAQLALTPTATNFLTAYRTLDQLNAAIASYGQGDSNFLDPTTRGGSSESAALNLQILSVAMGGKTYSQNDAIGSKPSNIGEIYIGTSVVLDPATVDEVNFKNLKGDIIISVTGGFASQSGQLQVNLEAQQVTDLLDGWYNIRTIEVNASDTSAKFSFSNNGGQADPGDVTP